MIEAGYEAVPEEDFVRMQWYGLYHDKPKLGYFMMRVKVPGGILSPAKLRTIGDISHHFSLYTHLSFYHLSDVANPLASAEEPSPENPRSLSRAEPSQPTADRSTDHS